MQAPWYTRPWRKSEFGGRSTVAMCCWLVAALFSVLLVATGDDTVWRVLAAVNAAIQIYLGATLLATKIRHRRLHAAEAQ